MSRWPRNVRVGHTGTKRGSKITLEASAELSPDEARAVARELVLRADFQDRTHDTRLVDEILRRRTIEEVFAERWGRGRRR